MIRGVRGELLMWVEKRVKVSGTGSGAETTRSARSDRSECGEICVLGVLGGS